MIKKLLLSGLLILAVSLVFAQSQRKVLLEHYTQASCGPCALYNPSVQTLIDANPDKIVPIKYQVAWPGTDPMNQHNPTEVQARVSYYPPSWGVPHSQLDGAYWGGHPANWSIATVNLRYAVPSPFEIELSHSLSSNSDSIYVTMKIKATMAVTGNLVAHIVVEEEQIHYASPPGSNGETDFYNVMKKMLPGSTGTGLTSSWAVGDSIVINQSWKFANVFDPLEIAVVGFVQDNTTKFVHQAEYSPPLPPVPSFDYDVAMLEVSKIPATNCSGSIAPKIKIKNLGAYDLTSLQIKYDVNNGTQQTHNWTGLVPFWSETEITLPAISFTVQSNNTVTIVSSSPNGSNDQNSTNDTLTQTLNAADVVGPQVVLYMRLDNSPQETTWELQDGSGAVVKSGGPYSSPGAFLSDTFNLTTSDCYTFIMSDQGGDGICCNSGIGFYQLKNTNGIFIAGSNFTDEDVNQFEVDISVGIDEIAPEASINVYPNPSDGYATLDIEIHEASSVGYFMYDLMGNKVQEKKDNMMLPGNHQFRIDANDLPDGIYFIKIRINDKVYSEKITLLR